MNMTYSAQLVADYFFSHTNQSLTAMHMIKMTYIAHGFVLAITKKPLIQARIEAWKYGPVIPALYQTYKGHGGEFINNLNYCGTMSSDTKKFQERKKVIESLIDPATCNILDQIGEHFGCLSALELSSLTHEKGTPWHQCYQHDKLFTLIPNYIIQEFYEQKMSNDAKSGY